MEISSNKLKNIQAPIFRNIKILILILPMISRKDNLLVRPWQQRKFENHRRKVQSALPAIDTSPPAYRSHVTIKLKKQQNENERCRKIERDNFLLLQKMDYIMKTSRLDNFWRTPQPNFLNKIAIYNIEPPEMDTIDHYNEQNNTIVAKSRRSKCYACTPTRMKDIKIPEERIPWEPSKKPHTRIRSKSVPVKRAETLPTIEEQIITTSKRSSSGIPEKRIPVNMRETKSDRRKKLSAKEPQSILLTRGCLKLYVNFPSDSVVKFQKGNVEKLLMKEACYCKNSPTLIY
ncbi:uncharacterized protein LOC108916474 [Anoplophora glabripennis]|nr:uncharacterized protein LOC108916474 [Anoplophora glabripennis]